MTPNQLKPYPGLRPFERKEASIFFGRNQQVDDLLKILKRSHFVAVLGASGSGKSSLVKAGMLPALDTGYMGEVGNNWSIAEMRPGNQPYECLAEALLADEVFSAAWDGGDENFLAAELRRGSRSLNQIIDKTPLGDNTNLMLLVDQFEEIFRYQQIEENKAAAFVSMILEAHKHPNIYVVITMRSGYLGNTVDFYGLPEAINNGLYLTPRLTREQLNDAISYPARLFDGEVENKLINHLLNAVGNDSDQLPLLQHALMRLWNDDDDKVLTLSEYNDLGGLYGSLDSHMNLVYDELDDKKNQKNIAKKMFGAMVDKGFDGQYVRRPVKVKEVCELADCSVSDLRFVIEIFRRSSRNFLTISSNPLDDETIIDISHESLIRQWSLLSKWADKEMEFASLYLKLEEASHLYKAGKGALWRNPDLKRVTTWIEEEAPSKNWSKRYGPDYDLVMDFVEKSKAQQKNELRNRGIQIFSLFLIPVIFIMLYLLIDAFKQQKIAEENMGIAEHNNGAFYLEKAENLEGQKRHREAHNASLRSLELLKTELARNDEIALARGNLLENKYIPLAKEFDLKKKIYEFGYSDNGRELTVKSDKQLQINLLTGAIDEAGQASNFSFSQLLTDKEESDVKHVIKKTDSEYFLTIEKEDDESDDVQISSFLELEDDFLLLGEYKGGIKLYKGNTLVKSLLATPSNEMAECNSGCGNNLLNPKKLIHPIYLGKSADNRNIIAHFSDGTVEIWRSDNFRRVTQFQFSKKTISSYFFFDSNKRIALITDERINIWDIDTGNYIFRRPVEGDSFVSASYFPKKKVIALGTSNGLIKFFDDRDHLETVNAHSGNSVQSILFSPMGYSLASGTINGRIKIWDLSSAHKSNAYIEDNNNNIIKYLSNKLVVKNPSSKAIEVYDLKTNWITNSITTKGRSFFDYKDERFIFFDKAYNKLTILNYENLEVEYSVPMSNDEELAGVALSNDGNLVAAYDSAGKITVWRSGNFLGSVDKNDEIKKIAISSQSMRILVGYEGGDVVSIDLSSTPFSKLPFSLDLTKKADLVGLGFDENDGVVYYKTSDGNTYIKNEKKFDLFIFKSKNTTHTQDLFDLSSDGKYVAAVLEDGSLNLWDYRTNELILKINSLVNINYLTFSRNNKFLYLVSDGEIKGLAVNDYIEPLSNKGIGWNQSNPLYWVSKGQHELAISLYERDNYYSHGLISSGVDRNFIRTKFMKLYLNAENYKKINGHSDTTLNLYLDALDAGIKHIETADDLPMVDNILNNLFVAFQKSGNYEKQSVYQLLYEKHKGIFNRLSDVPDTDDQDLLLYKAYMGFGLSSSLLAIGDSERFSEEIKKTKKLFNELKNIKISDGSSNAHYYLNLFKISLVSNEEFSESLEKEFLEKYSAINQGVAVYELYKYMSNVYQGRWTSEEAVESLKKKYSDISFPTVGVYPMYAWIFSIKDEKLKNELRNVWEFFLAKQNPEVLIDTVRIGRINFENIFNLSSERESAAFDVEEGQVASTVLHKCIINNTLGDFINKKNNMNLSGQYHADILVVQNTGEIAVVFKKLVGVEEYKDEYPIIRHSTEDVDKFFECSLNVVMDEMLITRKEIVNSVVSAETLTNIFPERFEKLKPQFEE